MAFIMSLLEKLKDNQDVEVVNEEQESLFTRYISSFTREYRGL